MTANIASSSAVGHAVDGLAEVGVEVDRRHEPTLLRRRRLDATALVAALSAGVRRSGRDAARRAYRWRMAEPQRRAPPGAALGRHPRPGHPVGLRRRVGARRRRHAAVPRRPRRPDAPPLRVHRAHGRGDRQLRMPRQPLTAVHLGAGALTIPRYVEATRPGSRQQVIELEPALWDLVREQLPLPRGGSIRVRIGDAREGLGRLPAGLVGNVDLLVSDVYSGAQTPAHLTTRRVLHRGRALPRPGRRAARQRRRRRGARLRPPSGRDGAGRARARDRARRGADAQGPPVRQPRDRGIRLARCRPSGCRDSWRQARTPRRSRRAPSSTSSRAARGSRPTPTPRRRRSPRHPSSSADPLGVPRTNVSPHSAQRLRQPFGSARRCAMPACAAPSGGRPGAHLKGDDRARREESLVSYIHGYDPETLREKVDPRQCKERLDEIGEQRSLPALLERVWLLKVLGRPEDALVLSEQSVRVARMAGTRKDLLRARILHASVHAGARRVRRGRAGAHDVRRRGRGPGVGGDRRLRLPAPRQGALRRRGLRRSRAATSSARCSCGRSPARLTTSSSRPCSRSMPPTGAARGIRRQLTVVGTF